MLSTVLSKGRLLGVVGMTPAVVHPLPRTIGKRAVLPSKECSVSSACGGVGGSMVVAAPIGTGVKTGVKRDGSTEPAANGNRPYGWIGGVGGWSKSIETRISVSSIGGDGAALGVSQGTVSVFEGVKLLVSDVRFEIGSNTTTVLDRSLLHRYRTGLPAGFRLAGFQSDMMPVWPNWKGTS